MASPEGADVGPLIEVRQVEASDDSWVHDFLLAHNRSLRVVSRGVLYQADELPGFIASLDGVPAALLTFHVAAEDFEVVTLHAAQRGRGLGSALLAAGRERARQLGCRRLWLITTNDNEPAIAFYRHEGMTLIAVHENALERSRQLKPEIPLTGLEGRPLRMNWNSSIVCNICHIDVTGNLD
jgi:ribosomal protein S18 acetylase RimI-like enzyme